MGTKQASAKWFEEMMRITISHKRERKPERKDIGNGDYFHPGHAQEYDSRPQKSYNR